MNVHRPILTLTALMALSAWSLRVEPIKYGDFNQWVTRHIHESGVIGGDTKTLYEIGPTSTIEGNKAYSPTGGSPWGTSNVYAKVKGISKGSNAVYPETRSGSDKCVRMASQMENVKVLGLINMDVMVAGSIFLGRMVEPITGTSNPYAKMECGVPYTKRPVALVYDYKVDVPPNDTRVKSSGLGKKKTLPGRDNAVVYVLLQHRWEDAQGNLHAKRVATASERFSRSSGWVNRHQLPLIYGNPVGKKGYDRTLTFLRTGDKAYYGRNSKGRMVPVIEEGYDADATPTHVVLMMSAGAGEPYVGTEGLTFYVDNVGFGF